MGLKKRETIAGLSGLAVGSVVATLLQMSKIEALEARANVNKAQLAENVSDLQARLAQAEANRTDLRARLAQAETNRTVLQTRMDESDLQAETNRTDLRARLAQAETNRTDLQALAHTGQQGMSHLLAAQKQIEALQNKGARLERSLQNVSAQLKTAGRSEVHPRGERDRIAFERQKRKKPREDAPLEHLAAVRAKYPPVNQAALTNQLAAAQRKYADEKKRTNQLVTNLASARAQLVSFDLLLGDLAVPTVLRNAIEFHTGRQGVVGYTRDYSREGHPILVVDGRLQEFEVDEKEHGRLRIRRMETRRSNTSDWDFLPLPPEGDLNKAIVQWLASLVVLYLSRTPDKLKQSLDSNKFHIDQYLTSTGVVDTDHFCFGAPTEAQNTTMYQNFVHQILFL